MKLKKLFLPLLLFIQIVQFAQGQKLPGRWEGPMGDEILQLNIVQQGEQLCGYSYDYRTENPDDHCKAYFTGIYDNQFSCWVLSGYRFIENSGTHIFMEIRVRPIKINGKTFLRGIVLPKGTSDGINTSTPLEIELGKSYISSSDLSRLKEICFPKPDDPRSPEKKKDFKGPEVVPERTSPVITEDIPVTSNTPTPNEEANNKELLKEMNSRKKTEFSHLVVNTRSIKLQVYDNGIVDNDTVSIFYNKKLLVSSQKLSEKPIEINLNLEEGVSTHELIMYAENLGSIPPNTALIVVTAGDKRYELHSSASLEENAVLVFEYRPL